MKKEGYEDLEVSFTAARRRMSGPSSAGVLARAVPLDDEITSRSIAMNGALKNAQDTPELVYPQSVAPPKATQKKKHR